MVFYQTRNSKINKPKSWKSSPTRMTSINLDASLHHDAREFNIPLKDALEFGIKFKMAEMDQDDYPENELSKRMAKIVAKLNEKSQECEDLKDKLKGEEDPNLKKDIEKTVDQEINEAFDFV